MGDVCRARRTQPFEAINELVALLALAHYHGRQLPVALQRPRHGALRLRQVQAIAAVVFADCLAFQLQHVLVGPTQHRLNVRAAPGIDQYGKLISRVRCALTAAVRGATFQEQDGAWRASCASAALVPRRAPWHAGMPACRTVAGVIAASARSIRSIRAGCRHDRKNFLGMTLAASGMTSFSGGFRSLTRSR